MSRWIGAVGVVPARLGKAIGSNFAHAELRPSIGAEQLMVMPAQSQSRKHWTPDDVWRLRDAEQSGVRYEVVDGELLVTPSPTGRHQRAVFLMASALYPYVRARRIGEAVISPRDVQVEPDTLTQPDVLVIPTEEVGRFLGTKPVEKLLLAVEILSPSSARGDRVKKRPHFQRAGVPEYWIVDLDARLVERWRPHDERPEVLMARLEWFPEKATSPWTLELPAYFSEVFAEEFESHD